MPKPSFAYGGSPERCASRSNTRNSRVTHGSFIWKSASRSMTRSSHLNLPRSTIIAIVAARKPLVAEPIWKTVCVSTAAPPVLLRSPKPLL